MVIKFIFNGNTSNKLTSTKVGICTLARHLKYVPWHKSFAGLKDSLHGTGQSWPNGHTVTSDGNRLALTMDSSPYSEKPCTFTSGGDDDDDDDD